MLRVATTPLRHEIGQIPTIAHAPSNCDRCHSKEMHLGPQGFLSGDRRDWRSRLPQSHVYDQCGLYRLPSEGRRKPGSTSYHTIFEKAIGEACVDCHGEGFDDTLKQWKTLLSKMENETNQRIFNVQKTLYEFEKTEWKPSAFKKAQSLLNEARHDYSFVLLGRGFTMWNMPSSF